MTKPRQPWDGIDRRKPENAGWRSCYEDLRRRGRSLRNSMIVLSMYLTLVTLWGYLNAQNQSDRNADAINQITQSRIDNFERTCKRHDRVVQQLEEGEQEALKIPGLTSEQRNAITQQTAFAIKLFDDALPRNPNKDGDTRPCHVIAVLAATPPKQDKG